MKRILLFCVLNLGLLLCGCVGVYTDMSHLSEQELDWTNCYNIGETVLFYSHRGKVDTLIVAEKEIHNTSNPFFIHYLDDYMGDKIMQSQCMRFILKILLIVSGAS